jgi:hypothetical protein
MKQNQKGWLKPDMKGDHHFTSALGTKTLEGAQKVYNPAMDDGPLGEPELKTSPGSIKHVK